MSAKKLNERRTERAVRRARTESSASVKTMARLAAERFAAKKYPMSNGCVACSVEELAQLMAAFHAFASSKRKKG